MDVPYLSSSPPPLVEQDLNDDDDDNVLVAQEEDEEFAPVSDLLPDLDEGFEPIALSVPVSTSDKCDDAEKKAAESFAAGSDQRSEESGKITGSPPRSVVGVPVVCEEGHDVDERHGHQESEVEAGISSIKGNEDEVGKVNTGLDQVQPDVDVPDDDFGDFASNALSEAVKTESDEVEKSVSSAAISDTQNGDVSEDAAPVAQETDPGWGTDPSWGADPDWATDPDWSSGQKGDGDDFGDFGEFASSNSFTSDLATDDVSDVQKAPSLASVFRQLFKAEPHPVDGQSVSNVSLSDANDLQLIAQLSDMDRSSGLSLSWANCKTRSSLLGVLNIDPTNIVSISNKLRIVVLILIASTLSCSMADSMAE